MSRVRFTKIATPSSPPANTAELYYTSTGLGFNSPVACVAVDESGNIANLGHFAVLDYKFLKVTTVTASGAGTWTPANGCRLAVAELIGGGAQGGGGATSSTQVSVGGGGGGGGYSSKTLTGAAIKSTSYTVGVKGSGGAAGASGGNGADTTWDTNVIVAKGGTGGAVMAAGTTVIQQLGGIGGASASGTGDAKMEGGIGGTGMRFGTATGFGGYGGATVYNPSSAGESCSLVGGQAGAAASAGAPGTGGGGAATSSTAVAGGAGADGMIIITEYA